MITLNNNLTIKSQLAELELLSGLSENIIYKSLGDNLDLKCLYFIVYFTKEPIYIIKGPGIKSIDILHLLSPLHPFINLYAPTQHAAKIIYGSNLFTRFEIPRNFQLSEEIQIKGLTIDENEYFINQLTHTQAFVIDNASMLTSAQLDNLDEILRKTFDSKKPFASMPMIFIADPFEFSPILNKNETKSIRKKYLSEYFFDSDAFKLLNPIQIEVNSEHKSDALLNLLNKIMNYNVTKRDLTILNQNARMKYSPSHSKYVQLHWSNQEVINSNTTELCKLKSPVYNYEASVKGDFSFLSTMPDRTLTLRAGARVIFTEGNAEHKYKYGDIGTVEELDSNLIIVRKDDGQEINVQHHSWKVEKRSENPLLKPTQLEVSEMQQYPLRLAFATTLYKSIGISFDLLFINTRKHRYYEGQLYAALCRANNIEGIELINRVEPWHFKFNPRVLEHSTTTDIPERIATILHNILNDLKGHSN